MFERRKRYERRTFLVLVTLCWLIFSLIACVSSRLSTAKLSEKQTVETSDGTDPPHAVDIDGKTIPPPGVTKPEKPMILSNASLDANFGELKREAAFDHAKHTSDVKYSLDGKTVTACVECHHTVRLSKLSNVSKRRELFRNSCGRFVET